MIRSATKIIFLFPVFHWLLFGFALPQAQGNTKIKDDGVFVHTLTSSLLDSPREIRVAPPRGYTSSTSRYPLLLVLDGEDYFAYTRGLADILHAADALPGLIVASVSSPDRWRDFTPTHAGIPGGRTIPTSGKAERFLGFLKSELIPFLDMHYRTHSFRILAGHSLSGLFCVHAFIHDADLFSACIATSPSLWWDEEVVTRELADKMSPMQGKTRFLFLAVGGEGPTLEDPCRRFNREWGRLAPSGISFAFHHYPDKEHSEMPVPGFSDALGHIFKGWRPPADLIARGLPGLRAHYATLSNRYGIALPIPEPLLNRLGYNELNRNHFKQAIEAFRLNVHLYPRSANVHDSLGDALAKSGSEREALSSYRNALKLDPANKRIRARISELAAAMTKDSSGD